MAAHRLFNSLGRVLVAWLAVTAMFAAEHHGVVTSNGLPVPGATVTASLGDKKLVTYTDDSGAYSFADLPDGIWTIGIDMLGFTKMSREIGVTADAPSPTWDLKVQTLTAMNADLAASKKAAETAAAATPATPAAGAAATPPVTAETKPATSGSTPTTATTTTPANGKNAKGNNNGRPSLTNALAQQRAGNNNNGFQRLDVNSSGDQNAGQDSGLGNDVSAGADMAQSSSDALVVGGSVSGALGMPQQNDWGFGGRGDMGGPGGPGFGGPGGFGDNNGIPGDGGPGGGRGGAGGPGGGPGGRGGGGPMGAMMGGGPGGFGGGGGRGGRGGGGAPGGRGGRAGRGGPNANSFGNGRRNPRSQYNGNVVFTLDNSVWDATPNSVTGVNAGKPAYAKFKAGFTFGGPLKIPHVFDDSAHSGTFTLTYNLNRSRNANTVFGEVPTEDERNGNLSQAISPTGQPIVFYNPGTNSPFPNNVIPTNLLNSAAVGLLAYYPLPNLAGNARYNYQSALRTTTNTDNITSRFSHSFNQKNQINGNIGWQRSNGINPNLFDFTDTTQSSGINASVAYQYRFTTRLFDRLSFSFSRSTNTSSPFFATQGDNVASQLGIEGTYQQPLYWGPPSINLQNFYDLNDGNPSLQRNQTVSIGDSITWIRGTHNMTFGGDTRFQQFNPVNESNARGSLTFNGTSTAEVVPCATSTSAAPCTSTVTGTGYDLASFLLGVPDTAAIAYGNADKYFRTRWWDVYANDDWRVTTKFSVQFGLRWDYSQPFTELQGRLVNLAVAPGFAGVTPVCGDAAVTGCESAATAGLPSALLHPDKRGIAPRFGLAYRPWVKHSTVIRGGYGLYWNTSFYQSIVNSMAQEAPLSNSFSVANVTTNPYSIQNILANGTAASALNGTTLQSFAINPNFQNGYSQQWQLSIQQNLNQTTVVTATYAGIKGTGLPQTFVPNTYPTGAVGVPVGLPTGFRYETSGGNSSYQAGTIQIQRRLRNGLGGSLGYTFSKLIDDAMLGGRGQGSSVLAQNWLDLNAERGVDSNPIHRLTATMQFSSGQGLHAAALLKGWKAHVLKDWTLSINSTVASGTPLTPTITAITRGTGISGQLRPEVVPAGYPDSSCFEGACFATPPLGFFGDAGRGILNGPTMFSMSGHAGRTFRLAERKNLDIAFDATNLLNHFAYTGYNTTFGTAQFGLPSGAVAARSLNMTVRFHF